MQKDLKKRSYCLCKFWHGENSLSNTKTETYLGTYPRQLVSDEDQTLLRQHPPYYTLHHTPQSKSYFSNNWNTIDFFFLLLE
jgi:hypothetical protein